jgi:hypothetical protein
MVFATMPPAPPRAQSTIAAASRPGGPAATHTGPRNSSPQTFVFNRSSLLGVAVVVIRFLSSFFFFAVFEKFSFLQLVTECSRPTRFSLLSSHIMSVRDRLKSTEHSHTWDNDLRKEEIFPRSARIQLAVAVSST